MPLTIIRIKLIQSQLTKYKAIKKKINFTIDAPSGLKLLEAL